MSRTPRGQTRERVFRFVRDRLLAGQPPTVREVQAAMGFAAVESARKHLNALTAEGRLIKSPGLARGYQLPERIATVASIGWAPLLGEVPAGDLDTAVQDPDGLIAVDGRYRDDELFALKVRGDSMKEAGILGGDIVVVRRQESAQSGEIVVALVEDEATVKTLRRRGRRFELHPENRRYKPIVPPPGELRILGRVVEVRRRL